MKRAVALVGTIALLASCGMVPQPRRHVEMEQAVDKADVSQILDHYRDVRNTAIGLLDAKPLSIVESGPMLAIDSGSFEVSQRLSRTESEDERELQVTTIEAPSFSRYPLWFMVTAFDPSARVDVVQIFERRTPVDPWLLVAAPQTVPSTRLPSVRHDGNGRAVRVAPSNGKGMAMSPQAAAAAYARALGSMSDTSGDVERDDFIRKMRSAFVQANRLEGVSVTQTWAAEKVEHALRTDDGGALVWVTLLRLDNYNVQQGIKVSWPAGSPQQAFLANGISNTGKLRYYHQVLLYLPGGQQKPRALGQYGGVVSADAQAALSPITPGADDSFAFPPSDSTPTPGPTATYSPAPIQLPTSGASIDPNSSDPFSNPQRN
jgi:hypothetical protein